MADDDDLFRQQMGGVKPIKADERVALRRADVSALAQQAAREAAISTVARDRNPLASDLLKPLDPHYILEYKRDGVQHGVFRRLKQGRYAQEARLDLHRMTVDRARNEVYEFIRQSCDYGLRTVLIVHGKGSHTQSKHALLKSYINQWLPEFEQVQAFSSAQPRDGGVGAVYVLLRKSENKKQENRDRFSRGRTIGG